MAIVSGTKTALVDVALCVADPGSTILLPDPGYPDYFSAVALAGARLASLPIEPRPDFDAAPAEDVAAVYLNYPSNPAAVVAPEGVFADAVAYAERSGALVLHDFAYGDLVFDGRRPASFLAEPGAKDVGAELFSMSKTYGMAGWRLGFVVGNAEFVRRLELLNDHVRAGIFVALQEAAIVALTGPQESVEERRALYEARRDRVVAALPGRSLRGNVLRLAAFSGRPDRGADSRGGTRRARAGRGLRRARRRACAYLARRLRRGARRGHRAASTAPRRVESSTCSRISCGGGTAST